MTITFNIRKDNRDPRGGGEENVRPCEMTPTIRDQRPSSYHKPLHRTARGREGHGCDAALGRALLADRGEKGRGKCTRERETSTWPVTLGLSPAAFMPRGTTCKEKTTAHRLNTKPTICCAVGMYKWYLPGLRSFHVDQAVQKAQCSISSHFCDTWHLCHWHMTRSPNSSLKDILVVAPFTHCGRQGRCLATMLSGIAGYTSGQVGWAAWLGSMAGQRG
eukprot:365766-Chlamydomonas_euryale.AAC.10